MNEQPEGIARLQKSLGSYIRPRQEASHIRRVLALHLHEAHQRDEASLPLALQELNDHYKPSTSRGLRKDYLKSLRANSKARKEYANIGSEHLDQHQNSTSKQIYKDPNEASLDNYVLLIKQKQRIERLQVLAGHLDHLDQLPPASQEFLDPKSFINDIEPLPSVPPAVLYEGESTDKGSSVKTVTELIHQLEKSVLQAKFLLDTEKKRTLECKSRLSQLGKTTLRGIGKQKLEALGRTRNEMILWMEEQLGKTGEGSEEENTEEPRIQESRISTESQLIQIQKEYRKYVIARQALLASLSNQSDDQELVLSNEGVESLESSHEILTEQRMSLLHPYLTELLSISNEHKAQILLRSYLNTCLAKQQKESMLSMDRLAEESHLLPKYPMKSKQVQRLAARPESLGGMLAVGERPDFISKARGWTFAADAAGHATKDAILEKVEEGRAFVDESLNTLLSLHQLLGYDMEEVEKDEDDIWAPESKSGKKGDATSDKERVENNRREIWSTLDGTLSVIRRENE